MRKFVVGVMGAGEGASERDLAAARELGRRIAAEGWVVLSGGRAAGVMQAVNAGAKEIKGSLTVGILPSSAARPSPDLDLVIVTDMGQARNNIDVLSSDVVVACGSGGPGTASEIALALKAGKRVILLSPTPKTQAFFDELSRGKIVSVETPTQVVEEIKRWR